MRLDKFLKVSRLIKRRTVANEACDAGRVLVNGKVAKASLAVKEGDVIEIRFLCQDEFGLGYDWLFANWTPEGEIPENQAAAGVVSGLGDLKLTWPE